ncbi:cytochrome c oxidase subunit II [Limnochorda pilosa]|uniref:Cytochrome C oxidase subunit II n=1 Tax=Limnochorda pilosa TaxID=1555112 RepID=A0A0K2SL06_LIMPI|nr:cytochrome c oxidase subunit II [Limnochorda pilosa]BAS27801.1 cytochrome C oxidase subunit II [Limnochorda pilosa]
MHVHPYERTWIVISVALLMVFGVAIVVSSLSLGVEIPGLSARLAPVTAGGVSYDQPWVRELGPGRYEANVFAQMWTFQPNEIRVPTGSTVTFFLHSRDLVHGFKIVGTNVSLMAIPGQVNKVSYTFRQPGEHLIVCTEYCGVGHQAMFARVIVEDVRASR